MKKAVAILFLFLYVYNLLGYYAVFKTLQYQVHAQIETRIKESIPGGEFVLIPVRKGEEAKLQWLDEHEFRYRGNMYDMVNHFSTDDTLYYVCIGDKQEERLFKNLDLHISAQCNTEGIPEKAANPFKGIIKEYVPQIHFLGPITFPMTRIEVTRGFSLTSHTADVPTPPPRLA